MIVAGELQDAHKARLRALKRPGLVYIMAGGIVTVAGLRLLKMLAVTFPRHVFLLVAEDGVLRTPSVAKAWAALDGVVNVRKDTVPGGAHGSEIGRRYAKLAERSPTDPVVEPGQD